MTYASDKLREARDLVRQGWAQEFYAVDWRDESAAETGKRPVCFCALGAIGMAVVGCPDADSNRPELLPFETILADAVGVRDAFGIVEWNDTPGRKKSEVVAAFDKAIALAERLA